MKNLGLTRFPLGFWQTLDAENISADQPLEWAELGMTTTLGVAYNHGITDKSHFRAILDCAHSQNIKIIVVDSRANARSLPKLGEEQFRANLQAVEADWGDHPAIWGIFLGDEPWKEDYEDFVKALRIAKEIAPQWEPYANLLPWYPGHEKMIEVNSWPEYIDDYVKDSGVNFVSYDCYAQMNNDEGSLMVYFSNLKMHSDAAKRNNMPFWTCLLCVPHFKYRDPSLDEIRWQFNTAIASGVQGIVWFYIYQQQIWDCNYRNAPVNQVGRRTQQFYQIQDIHEIFRRTLEPEIMKLTLEKIYHIGHAHGGFELFQGDDRVELVGDISDMIMTYFYDKNDPEWKYILLVNNSFTESVYYTLGLKGEHEVYELICDGEWKKMAGKIQDCGEMKTENNVYHIPHWYAPGQAVMYKYKSV